MVVFFAMIVSSLQ